MRRLAQRIRGSFKLKVILSAVVVMGTVLGVTGAMINRGFTRQFEAEAAEDLRRDGAAFIQWHEIRGKALAERFRSLAHEPRIKGVMTTGDGRTIRGVLLDLLDQVQLDAVFVTDDSGGRLAEACRSPLLRIPDIAAAAGPAVDLGLQGQVVSRILVANGHLIEAVSVPVSVGAGGGGVVTFASEAGASAIQEFRRLSSSDVVLVEGTNLLASTLPAGTDVSGLLASGSRITASTLSPTTKPRRVQVGGVHYLTLADTLPLRPESPVGYLLLSSYEASLQNLHAMQRALVLIGLGGILLGSGAIGFLLSQVLKPLGTLRAGAEAIGRGDLTHQVPVTGPDECGQLGDAFNQMSRSLLQSRNQLEAAHESLKSAQAQLIEKEKLSAVGEFVAGVTHELNNPLAVILGYAQLLGEEALSPDQGGYLRHIVGGVERCRKITRGLLAFARQGPSERVHVQINDLLEETLGFLQFELRTSKISVVRQFEPRLPLVTADPQQLQQVFLNIMNNARQAMEERGGNGMLTLTTRSAEDQVRIVIEDDGPGIRPEHLGRLFTPFFTTKPVGKGTGLGMSVSYGIVRKHGGEIRAESPPGSGARFTIELPSATGQDASAGARTTPTAPGIQALASPNRNAATAIQPAQRVLVVDDEESFLSLYQEVLHRRGFEVETAADGDAALARLAQADFDIILCDLRMPGLTGQETLERIQQFDPRIAGRMIFITGDTVSDQTRTFIESHDRICLSKPFSMEEFLAAVVRVSRAA
jgi:two-component system, NtrC family, sensor kinase